MTCQHDHVRTSDLVPILTNISGYRTTSLALTNVLLVWLFTLVPETLLAPWRPTSIVPILHIFARLFLMLRDSLLQHI